MKLEEKKKSVQRELNSVQNKISKFQKAIENPGAFSRHKEFYEDKMEELIEEREYLYEQLDRLERKEEAKFYA